MAFPQTADLVVDQVEHAQRMARPVVGRILLGCNLLPGVADQQCPIALECGLQAKVVVDAAIAENHSLREWRSAEVGARGLYDRLVNVERCRREDWRKGRGSSHNGGKRQLRVEHQPYPIVSHVAARKTPEGSCLHVRGVEDETGSLSFRVVGQIAQGSTMEHGLVVSRGHAIADRSRQ